MGIRRSFGGLLSSQKVCSGGSAGNIRKPACESFRRRSGFTIIELILALAIIVLISRITDPVIRNLHELRKGVKTGYQDEIGIYQLQIALAKGDVYDVSWDAVLYRTDANDCILHLVNRKLISQPGTLDFIHDIDDAHFELRGGMIYLTYEREETETTWPIAYYKP